MKNLIIILLLSLSFTYCFAKNNATVIHDTVRVANNSKELELYKMLYQNAKDDSAANHTMLFTIVAIVVAFILFIVGSQAFFNYRLNKSDLDKLKSEIKGIELKLTREILNAATNSNDKFEALDKFVQYNINTINIAVNELMAIKFKSSGHIEPALINYVGRCTASLDAGLDGYLKISLDTLKEFLLPLTEISEFTAKRIQELLVNIPKKYPTEFSKIIGEIKVNVAKKKITDYFE